MMVVHLPEQWPQETLLEAASSSGSASAAGAAAGGASRGEQQLVAQPLEQQQPIRSAVVDSTKDKISFFILNLIILLDQLFSALKYVS